MSLHTWRHQGPHKSSSCATFMLNSQWGRAATGKRVLPLCMQGLFGHVLLFVTLDCGLPGFSVRESVLQARIQEHIGQYWLPYPSRALYFLLP